MLVDHYDEDWEQLWWARADGRARVEQAAPAGAAEALVGRYRQYREQPPEGPFIVIEVERFSGWSAAYSAAMERTLYSSEHKDLGESFRAFLTRNAASSYEQWEQRRDSPARVLHRGRPRRLPRL